MAWTCFKVGRNKDSSISEYSKCILKEIEEEKCCKRDNRM